METKVKGTFIQDYVRLIRANKDKDWDKYFEPGDWEIINGQVLPSNWYPYEVFRRLGRAVLREIAQSKVEMVRTFGRFMGSNLLKVYKGILVPGDPVASLERVATLKRNFLTGDSDTRLLDHGQRWARLKVFIPSGEDDPELVEGFCNQYGGILLEVVEQAGAKNVTLEIEQAQDNYVIKLKWE